MNESPQWLDQQYNPFISVPDAPALFADWEVRSAKVRSAHDCQVNVAYGSGPLETLDVFPAKRPQAPVLVFIHGGYWRGSDKQAHSFIAAPFLQKGAAVVLLNYALCPAVTIRKISEQIESALAWVHKNIASYGGNPEQVVLAGHSAGAHLAAMALLRKPPAQLRKALCLSGLFDLAPLRLAPFIRDTLNLSEQEARALSPVHAVPPEGVQVIAAVGEQESEAFHQQTQDLQNSWGTDAVSVMDRIAQRHHFDVLEDLADEKGVLHACAWTLLSS